MNISTSRIKAFLIHFFISVCVISVFIYFVLFVWYPFPFDYFYSPFDVLKIVLGVDLIIGPLLTLVLYDIKKKAAELTMDISLVVLLQLVAFSWGVHVTYTARPVILVFANDTFYMFSSDELDTEALKRKELKPVFWKPPQLAVLDPPKSAEELTQLFREYFVEGKPELTIRTDRYLPLREGFDHAIQFSINIDETVKDNQKKQIVDNFLENMDGDLSQYVFFPVKGTSKSATLVLTRKGGEITGLMEKSA